MSAPYQSRSNKLMNDIKRRKDYYTAFGLGNFRNETQKTQRKREKSAHLSKKINVLALAHTKNW